MDALLSHWPLLPIWLLGSILVLALVDRAGIRRGTTTHVSTYGSTRDIDAPVGRPRPA